MLKFGESLRDVIGTIGQQMLSVKVNSLRNVTTAKGCKPYGPIQKQYGCDCRLRGSPKRKQIMSVVMILTLDI